MIVAFLIAAMADLVICLLAAITYLIVGDGRAPAVEQAPRGRHYEDSIEMVTADYRPILNADLAALLNAEAMSS